MIERMDHISGFSTKLRRGALMVGTLISEIRNPNVMYMLAQSGFDFVIVDMEHGAYSPETVSDHIAAARGAGIPVIVRICEIRRETILKPLDSGAVGLLVPQVNTAEQAREIVSHAKYPPEGNRGVAIRRAHNFYRKVDAAAYMKQTNEQTFIAVQAESPEAIENLEAIADVPGVDSIFVGPFDLSVSLGIPGKLQDPQEVAAIERVVEVCRQRGIVSGIMLFDKEHTKDWIRKGMRFMTYSSDIGILADAAAGAVSELKDSL
jgi:2-keto-3-deoxy-L-rhamnonate aldolase RhmA